MAALQMQVEGLLPGEELYCTRHCRVTMAAVAASGAQCVLKASTRTRTAETELHCGRDSAGLGIIREEASLNELRDEAVAAAQRTHLLVPMKCEMLPSGQHCLVAPYVGATLRGHSCLKDAKVGWALRVARDIATALSHMHSRRWIHLDVKPSNIIIDDETGDAYLMDFSISRKLPRLGLRQAQDMGGTRAYMAPEQSGRIAASADLRSDLYSLGVTLYEILAGFHPYLDSARSPAEWVHAHIAHQPRPLPDTIPHVVQRVIFKLLRKDKEERYSSALMLQHDLDTIMAAEATGLNDMLLDEPRISVSLQPLPTLFGCDRQLDAVLDCFSQAAVGLHRSMLVLVKGPSGAGKSSLMRAANKRLGSDHSVLMCEGKFMQYERTPYAAVVKCFEHLVIQLQCMESRRQGRVYKLLQRQDGILQHAAQLGTICAAFSDLVVSIKKQPLPKLEPCGSEEERARYAASFSFVFSFFYNIARVPLVMFLDDLQWSDDASLSFLQSVMLSSDVHVLLFGSYRDNEVSATHPLAVTLSKLREHSEVVKTVAVQLQPWSLSTMVDVLRVSMGVLPAGVPSEQELNELAVSMHYCTAGNPFFTLQLLYGIAEDGILWHSREERRWMWDTSRLATGRYSDNVVGFFLGGLQQQDKPTRHMLGLLALIGYPAPLRLLSKLFSTTYSDPDSLTTDAAQGSDPPSAVEVFMGLVNHAVDSGIVAHHQNDDPPPLTGSLSFTHDRLEEGALGLVDDDDLPGLHIAIAKAICADLGFHVFDEVEGDDDDSAHLSQLEAGLQSQFACIAIEHFLAARELLEAPREVSLVARFAAKTGRAFVGSLAYGQGRRFLEEAAQLELSLLDREWHLVEDKELRERLWQLQYDWGHAYALCCDIPTADEILAECQMHSDTLYARAKVCLDRSGLAGMQEDYHKSVKLGLEAAAMLGVQINPRPTMEEATQFLEERIMTHFRAAKAKGGILADAVPEIRDDPLAKLLDEVIESMVPSSFLSGNVPLWATVPAMGVAVAIERGFSTEGTFASMAVLGVSMGSFFGLRKEGHEVGVMGALKLYERYRPGSLSSLDPTRYLHAGLSQQWGEGILPALPSFEKSFSRALQLGKYQFCAYARTFHLWYCMQGGLSYQTVLQLAEERIPFVRQCGVQDMVDSMRGAQYAAGLLVGNECAPTAEQLMALEEEMRLPRSPFTKAACFVWMMLAYHALGRHADALRMYRLVTDDVIENSSGMSPHYEYHWIGALVCSRQLSLLHSTAKKKQSSYWKQLVHFEHSLAEWAEASPSNWNAKHLLVRGHMVSHSADSEEEEDMCRLRALRLFEKAISAAATMQQVVALAADGGAVAASQLGCTAAAAGLQSKAVRAWKRMSARAVANNHRRSSTAGEPAHYTTSTRTTDHRLFSTVSASDMLGASMDLSAILRAGRVISSKVSLRGVVLEFLNIIEQTAGANYAALLLFDAGGEGLSEIAAEMGELHVAAIRHPAGVEVRRQELTSAIAPERMLRECLRRRRCIVVTDASCDVECLPGGSLADEYFTDAVVRSALAVPVPNQDNLQGVIYLENSSASGVFTHQTTIVLGMLVAQLGISLQNARLYEALSARQRDLEATNKRIAAAQKATFRFVPESFLHRIGKHTTLEVELGDAVAASLTIMFCDVRSFTSMSEAMDAHEVFQFLNRLLAEVVPCISRHNGSVDKFLGDGTLSLFSRAGDALRAARAIQAAVRALNRAAPAGSNPVAMGVGIHTGHVTLGCLGTESRLDATVVGDTVNVASRVEALTKPLGVGILATAEAIAQALEDGDDAELVRCLGGVRVEGKLQPLPIYEVLEQPAALCEEGEEGLAAVVEHKQRSRSSFEEGLRLGNAGETEAAGEVFRGITKQCPADGPAAVRLQWLTGRGSQTQLNVSKSGRWGAADPVIY